ncbi:MAG: PQQ-dependent sugar dehydrogenase [Candidatus Nitrosocosmicus sp.]|nr:PQQ-dependent sugar dehydrogenase [Candidatus Nitrosocosmicus sp.]
MVTSSILVTTPVSLAFGAYAKAPISPTGPTVSDENLAVEKVVDGLDIPTSMAFLGPNDILVTEKETGKVKRIINGQIQETPLIDLDVATSIERGLLGIAVSKQQQGEAGQPDGKTYVFLSYTESGNDEDGSDLEDGAEPLGNRLYRYEYVDGKLVNPILLLDLTANPPNDRGEHNGGKIRIGPDNNVYFMVGEVGGHRTQAQNVADGPEPNGLGGVLRITQDGDVVNDDISPIFGDEIPLSLYYAMGIRNSFGMDFDPLTGNLWDTENGPDTGDEINLVFPGFNSGWVQVQGFMEDNLLTRDNAPSLDDLVYFGKSKYADPKFAWEWPIGITALKFLNSDKLGTEYQNDMFVGDINNGLLYRFTLNEARNNIVLDSTYSGNLQALEDNRIQNPKENLPLIFGQGFGGITDIQVGPDGYLYILSYEGSLYKILPLSESTKNPISGQSSNVPLYNEEGDDGNRLEVEDITGQSIGDDSNNNNRVNSIPVAIIGINGSKSYSPDPIEIQEGQTVTWYNGDSISHTVTSGEDNGSDAGSGFDSDAIIPNQYYSLTFDESGDYKYYCIYHPSMVGEVIVE